MTTNKTLAIFGFGGHSKVIKDIAYLNGYNSYVYYDDYQTNEKIVGKSNDLIKHKNEISDLFIAIGDNNLRKKKLINYKTFKDKKYVMPYWGPNFSNDEIKKTLKKSHIIKKNDLIMKKPSNVISYANIKKIIGKKLKKHLDDKRILKWSDFE